jgi:hypothetical protein
MNGRWLVAVVFLLGSCLITGIHPSYAQDPSGKLTILYTNNINAEIDPCPS